MGLPQHAEAFDAQAYLTWEAAQPERHEYVAGEVFAMVGVRQAHNVASLSLTLPVATVLEDTEEEPES